jgi:hypothetical protein
MTALTEQERALRPCFPDGKQRLLLDVCLAPAERAVPAWEQWITSVDLDTLEPASSRLLPLAAQRLAALRVAHKEVPRLSGVLRHAWANNLTLRRRVDAFLSELKARNVEHIVLKGLPLAFDVYPNPGARAMDDVDVLVPFERAWEVLDLLKERGWTALFNVPARGVGVDAESALCFQHGCAFRSPEGLHLDLHWFAMEECSYQGADAGFWSRRRPVSGAVQLWQLSPADQLLHVCVHGLRVSPIGSIRWIADAILLVRKHGEALDWTGLLEEARQRRLIVPVRHALGYLMEYEPAILTQARFDLFRAEKATWLERAAHHGNVGAGLVTQFAATWLRYRRMTPKRGPVARVFGFPRFLQQAWGTRHIGAVGVHILRRIMRGQEV